MHAALGKPRLMGQVSHALGGIVTQTLENPQAFVPQSHVGPVLRRVTELVAEFSLSAYTTDTQLSRVKRLPGADPGAPGRWHRPSAPVARRRARWRGAVPSGLTSSQGTP